VEIDQLAKSIEVYTAHFEKAVVSATRNVDALVKKRTQDADRLKQEHDVISDEVSDVSRAQLELRDTPAYA